MELDRREAELKKREEQITRKARELEKARRATPVLDQKRQQKSFAAERLSTPSSSANNFAAQDAGTKYSTKSDSFEEQSRALVTPGPLGKSTTSPEKTAPNTVSEEAKGMLRRSRPALQSLFDTYSNKNVVTLKQFFRLCADFDLYPTFLTRAGVKKCFEKVAGAVSLVLFCLCFFWRGV
jgi:hypothetical protein